MDGLARHVALEEIKTLEARRNRLLDMQGWPAHAALHVAGLANDAAGPKSSIERQIAWLRDELKDAVTVHHVHSPDIEFTAPDRATGIWAIEAMTVWRRADGVQRRHSYGYYHVVYERCDDVWKIAGRRQVRVRTDNADISLPA